ncbi:hypothetical protein O9929_02915 [Vibrio lentus]|nr:hypothetical protein [Vibrio lentus]
MKQKDDSYVLSVLVQNNRQPNQSPESRKNLCKIAFDAIGDVILEIKAIIAPMNAEYGWQAIE